MFVISSFDCISRRIFVLLFSFWSKEMGLWVGSTLPNIFIIGSFECEYYDCVNIATAPRSKWTSAWTVYCSLQLSRYDFMSFYHGEKKNPLLAFSAELFFKLCIFPICIYISSLFLWTVQTRIVLQRVVGAIMLKWELLKLPKVSSVSCCAYLVGAKYCTQSPLCLCDRLWHTLC